MNSRTSQLRTAWAVILLLGSSGLVLGQDGSTAGLCDLAALTDANSRYEIGMFDQTIGRLKPCLPNGFKDRDERVGAYRLLALSYIVTDSLEQARSSVRQLVRADRKYRPDIENDPPLFTDMVQDAKPAWYAWFYQGGSAPQWIGRAPIVGAAVSLPFLLKEETVQPLPEPPALPSR